MQAQPLYRKINEEFREERYFCGKCGTIYVTKEQAEKCCEDVICLQCGKHLSQDRTKPRDCVYWDKEKPLCYSCWEFNKRQKETVWTEEEYYKQNKENNNKYYPVVVGDDFYSELDEAIVGLWDDGLTKEEILDTLIYVCEEKPYPRIDIDNAVQSAEEEIAIDGYVDWVDLPALYAFVKLWNDKQTGKYWESTNIQLQVSRETVDRLCEE